MSGEERPRVYIGCPEALLSDPEIASWLELYMEYKMFGFRYPGTYADQPDKYLAVLKELEIQRAMMDAAERERAKNANR